jgi:hypothetical protein
MTTEELTRALTDMEARLTALERQVEIVRDLLSRCLLIPIPQYAPLPPSPRTEDGSAEGRAD